MKISTFADSLFFSQKKRDIFSATVTFVITCFLTLILALIPLKKPKYTEVRIQLNASDVPKILPEANASEKTESANKTESTKSFTTQKSTVENKTATATNTQTAPSAPSKSEPAPAQRQTRAADIQPRKSVEEMIAENASRASVKKTTWDDAFTEDSWQESNSSEQKSASLINQNASVSTFEGSAASSFGGATSTKASTTGGRNYGELGSGSSEITDSLQRISGAEFSARDFAGDSIVTYKGSGMTGNRKVVSTSPIILSEEAASTVLRNVEVLVSMLIDEKGFVIKSSIKITPEGQLSSSVQSEVKNQIAKWLFETGESIGQATFKYNIIIE